MLFTVGYEGRTVAQLVLRLREAAVERVVDVRRSPDAAGGWCTCEGAWRS